MPLPPDLLRGLLAAELHLDGGQRVRPGQPFDLPPELEPAAWGLLSGLGAGEGSGDGAAEHADLVGRLRQARLGWVPARLVGPEVDLQVALVPGLSRNKAVAMGYRTGQWAVLRVGRGGLDVVYTGLNSRVRRPDG